MVSTHILGFPRIGAQRELKFALEDYWRGNTDLNALEATGATLRKRGWAAQKDAGLDWVTVGDFAFYDHVANHIQLLGCEPARFGFDGTEPELTRYFTMARGVAREAHGTAGAPALDMTKWFDTNYHYLVPEFTPDTSFSLASERLFTEVAEALDQGHAVKTVLIGPLTFLWLGKEKSGQTNGFNRLDLIDRLIPVYQTILARLAALGVSWVQLDEPILGLDLPAAWRRAFEPSYALLANQGPSILLATYFSPLQENINLACRLPINGLHIDGVRAPEEIDAVADWLPQQKTLSLGLIDGRNIWRSDLDALLYRLQTLRERHEHPLWLAPSCSLLHVPIDLERETELDPDIKQWMAFATQKLAELVTLARALNEGPDSVSPALTQSRNALAARRASPRVHNPAVQQALRNVTPAMSQRPAPYTQRAAIQTARLPLPLFPTTTIGSFPQTDALRQTRARYRAGQISRADYRDAIRAEIAHAVREQEALGLDVLVHGEAERTDMVEYFGETLDGFALTRNGWVQSYGSRCVKPPVLFGDVHRSAPITIEWATYAQSLTDKPMKGMLTGPVTILNWSFVRDDQPREVSCQQIALAIRDEVLDLEASGIPIIQIDEAALREGLPLRKAAWTAYLKHAVHAFKLAAAGVRNETQIHTHMCYSEFNDILPAIAEMDADVITIETSRSDMALLDAFEHFCYPNAIGPGVYDIHSPRRPTVEEMTQLLERAAQRIPAERLWVNPDCGLKTRQWDDVIPALHNLVEAAARLRAKHEVDLPA